MTTEGNRIAQRYLDTYGNHGGAIAALVHDLMTDEPATFKAGYSRENAIIAASEIFNISLDETRYHVGDTPDA